MAGEKGSTKENPYGVSMHSRPHSPFRYSKASTALARETKGFGDKGFPSPRF